jgi:signal transduction histidine kinase
MLSRFRHFRNSLRARVALGVAFPILLSLALLSLIHYLRERQLLEEQIQLTAVQVGEVALGSVRHTMLENDFDLLDRVATDIDAKENVQRVQVINLSGQVLIDTSRENLGEIRSPNDLGCHECHGLPGGPQSRTTILTSPSDTLRISSPIDNDPDCMQCHEEVNDHLGVLLIDFSLIDTKAHLLEDFRVDLAISAGVTALVTGGVYLLIHLLVVQRVELFSQPLDAFTSGDFTARLPSPDKLMDELDTLASAFNRMAGELESQIEEQEQRHQLRQQAIIEERERIAREMHDGIAQLMGYVNTKASAVRLLLNQGQIEEARSQLHQLAEASRQSFNDLRLTILGLRMSDSGNLVQALKDFSSKFIELNGIDVELKLPSQGTMIAVPPESELQLLRITQEALSNVQKHSDCEQAWIHLSLEDHMLEITIGDDGIGFDPQQPPADTRPRFGLSTMRERAEAIGASIHVDSEPDAGTRLTVRLPLEAPS